MIYEWQVLCEETQLWEKVKLCKQFSKLQYKLSNSFCKLADRNDTSPSHWRRKQTLWCCKYSWLYLWVLHCVFHSTLSINPRLTPVCAVSIASGLWRGVHLIWAGQEVEALQRLLCVRVFTGVHTGGRRRRRGLLSQDLGGKKTNTSSDVSDNRVR